MTILSFTASLDKPSNFAAIPRPENHQSKVKQYNKFVDLGYSYIVHESSLRDLKKNIVKITEHFE